MFAGRLGLLFLLTATAEIVVVVVAVDRFRFGGLVAAAAAAAGFLVSSTRMLVHRDNGLFSESPRSDDDVEFSLSSSSSSTKSITS